MEMCKDSVGIHQRRQKAWERTELATAITRPLFCASGDEAISRELTWRVIADSGDFPCRSTEIFFAVRRRILFNYKLIRMINGYKVFLTACIMSILRSLSHEVIQAVLSSSKQNLKPLAVTYFTRSSPLDHSNYSGNTVNLNLYQDFVKRNFHTSNNNRDIELGLKSIGAGLTMIGALGPGIGIGTIYGQLLSGTARNPSTKDQLFTLAIMGTVFCETICLFCFLISMIIINS